MIAASAVSTTGPTPSFFVEGGKYMFSGPSPGLGMVIALQWTDEAGNAHIIAGSTINNSVSLVELDLPSGDYACFVNAAPSAPITLTLTRIPS